jgi:hypothetical protein
MATKWIPVDVSIRHRKEKDIQNVYNTNEVYLGDIGGNQLGFFSYDMYVF